MKESSPGWRTEGRYGRILALDLLIIATEEMNNTYTHMNDTSFLHRADNTLLLTNFDNTLTILK